MIDWIFVLSQYCKEKTITPKKLLLIRLARKLITEQDNYANVAAWSMKSIKLIAAAAGPGWRRPAAWRLPRRARLQGGQSAWPWDEQEEQGDAVPATVRLRSAAHQQRAHGQRGLRVGGGAQSLPVRTASRLTVNSRCSASVEFVVQFWWWNRSSVAQMFSQQLHTLYICGQTDCVSWTCLFIC